MPSSPSGGGRPNREGGRRGCSCTHHSCAAVCCACCASEARLASTSTFFKTERTHRRRGTRTKICPYNNVSAVLLSCQPTQRGLVVRNTGSSVFDGKFSSAGLVTAASCPLGDTKSQNSRMPNGLYARAKLAMQMLHGT